MHDLPSVMLLQQSHAKSVGGEELELMGKQAADLFATTDCSLNQAVVTVVKKAGLAPEQVRRVVEFANTRAFLTEFAKEGSHKVVEFRGGPADPSVVMKDLNDGGGGSVFDPGDGQYNSPPPQAAKTAAVDDLEQSFKEAALEQGLGRQEQTYPYASPFADSLEAKEKLSAAYDELVGEISVLQSDLLTVSDKLFGEVKKAALNGASLGEVVTAWHEVTDNPELVKAAFTVLTPELLRAEVFSTRDQIAASLEKTAAGGLVNTNHPLVTSFETFCDTLEKLANSRAAADEVKGHLDELTSFLKEAVSGAIPKAWRAANEAARAASGPMSEVAGGAARTLFGEGAGAAAGKIVEKGVAHSPKILAAYGGTKAHKKLERSSPAYNQALSYIPYTQQNAIRKQYRG